MFEKIIKRMFVYIMISFVTISSCYTFANQAEINPSFDTGLPVGLNNTVKDIIIQNNKILVVGLFNSYKGISSNRIIRLNNDGSKDISFNIDEGFNNAVNTIILQNDGKILAGGKFGKYNGEKYNKIIRLTTNGSIDYSFNIGNGFNGNVNHIVLQNDGKILVGGDFTKYNGVTYNKLVRLNADGSIDSSFDIGNGFNGTVNDVEIQNDGKILVGGNFSSFDSVSYNKIVRLNADGSRDYGFNIGDGFNGTVNDIKIQNNGQILVGGNFSSFDSISSNKFICLNNNGSKDYGFNIGDGFNGEVIHIQEKNNKIFIGGKFYKYNGTRYNRFLVLNNNGTVDNSFDLGNGFNGYVESFVFDNNEQIIIGGSFKTYDGKPYNRIAKINIDGSYNYDFDIGNGFNDSIFDIELQDDGKVVVGGRITTYKGIEQNRLIRLNTNGSVDYSFNIGDGFNNNVHDIAIYKDKVILVGDFKYFNGNKQNRIILLNNDGSKDYGFDIGDGFNNRTTVIKTYNNKIVVGGKFTKYNGNTYNKLIRLNSDGSVDNSFDIGNGFNGDVESIYIQNDGKILVGGNFTKYQGLPHNKIIRLNIDGSVDNSFDIGNGFNDIVYDIKVWNDKIIIAGKFTKYNEKVYNKLIRLNSDGSVDNSFNIGDGFNNTIYELDVYENGNIIAGGIFSKYKSEKINKLIRLNVDGSKDNSFDIGNGFNNTVNAISIKDETKILIGGNFTTYNNQAAGYLVALYGESDVVMLPNSTDINIIKNEFKNKGYTEEGSSLIGDKAISLSQVNGNIPTRLEIKNNNVKLILKANTQFKKSDNIINYEGIISAPIKKDIDTVMNEQVISSFKVGSTLESIKLQGQEAELYVGVDGVMEGEKLQIYYSEDNGATWYPHTESIVTNDNGKKVIEFTTTRFTDFAVTIPDGEMVGSFTINNDATSTTSQSVTLNISTAPAANQMRFSNDGNFDGVSWTPYSTSHSWELSNGYGGKTVYAQFDADGDNISDVETQDSITYSDNLGTCGAVTADGVTRLCFEIIEGTSTCSWNSDSYSFGSFIVSSEERNISISGINYSCELYSNSELTITLSDENLVGNTYTIPALNIIGDASDLNFSEDGSLTAGASWSTSNSQMISQELYNKINGQIGNIIQYFNVNLTVPAGQPADSYTANLTITIS